MGSDYGDSQISLTTVATLTTGLVLIITTICISLSYYISSLSMKKKLKGRPPLLPGSLGLPLIGASIQFANHTFRNTLDSFIESKQAKYGQTFKMSVMGYPLVIMESQVGNKFLMFNEGKLVETSYPQNIKVLLGPDSMIGKTGEEYKIVRRHVTQFLSPGAVRSYLPLIERETVDHLEAFWQPPAGGQGDQSVNLSASKLIKQFIFKVIANLCMGLQPGPEMVEVDKLFAEGKAGILQLPVNLPGFPYHRALKARRKLADILGKFIAKRRLELKEGRALPTQDMLSGLLTRPDEKGRMSTDGELIDNCMMIWFAGFDSTSSALEMLIMHLAKHPQIRQRMKEEHDTIAASKGEGDALKPEDLHRMQYTWQVVQESMRLVPPVLGSYRETLKDFEFNGFTILKGWKIYWTNQTCHENPRYFEKPKEFNPSRFEVGSSHLVPYTFLPFGGGPRVCPGMDLVKTELLVFVHHLVRKYTWTLIDPNESIFRAPLPQTLKGTLINVKKLAK